MNQKKNSIEKKRNKFNIYPNEVNINGNKQISSNSKSYIFNQTDNFVELIWDNNLQRLRRMFNGCINITEIDFSYFNSSEVTDMAFMFQNCWSLTSINLLNFDTSKVFDTGYTFSDCLSLTSLDLSNFDTSSVTYMGYMFQNCISLTSLNLSKFNTSIAERMRYMFYNCTSLSSLDLSNFDTTKVVYMHYMFYGCINLEYINMKNFNDINLEKYQNIFNDVPENIVICINESITNNKILPQIKNKACHIIECSNDWNSRQKKIIHNNGSCVNSCEDDLQYKYEYNSKCYENCTNGYFIDNKNNTKCKCELEKCLTCPPVALNKNLCTECNTGYYQKENDSSNIGKYINCYKEPKGYYLDRNDNLYKKCYYKCGTCKIEGNNITHNCLECNDLYPFSRKFNNYTNCYENCSYYHYFDNENNHYCTTNSSCPDEYPKFLEDKMECIRSNIKNILQDIIINNETDKKGKEEVNYYNNILDIVEKGFTSGNYDTSNLDNGKDEIIETEKMTITFTTTQHQKNITDNNMTLIDLGECEILLRGFYNLSNNDTLYMKKIDIVQKGMKIPKVEYDIYCKLSGNNLEKLNKSICENAKISLSIPVEINENLDKINTSSGYFNDICYSSTSDSGTDISLNDRKKEFIENNKTVCQGDCILSNYNYSIKKANCSCQVTETSASFDEMNIDKNKLYNNFGKSKKEVSNLGVTSCNVLGSKENIESNAGFISLIIIFAIFIIIFIIFCSKGYDLLENKIDEVINKKFKSTKKNNKINKLTGKSSIKKRKTQTITRNNKKSSSIKFRKIDNFSLKKNSIKGHPQQNNIKKIFLNKIKNTQKSETYNLKPVTDYELNWLSYKEAIKYDTRSSCEYYGSLIKSKQLFFFTFCSFNDYNSGIIKKFILFLSFAFHYTINALFFDESNMHQIYEDKGTFNFEYQISYIIYSAIISTIVLRLILQFFVLTDKDVLRVKNQKTKGEAVSLKKKVLKYMKIKFFIFFILNFILLGLFWYYLTCFNAIYKNTQIYLIENTFISFGFSLVYPFIINIFPTIIRMCSIHSTYKNQEYFYKFSKIIQIL